MCPIRRQQTPLEIPSPAGSAPLLSARCQPGSEKEKTRRMKKEMLINVLQPEECRIAIVEDGVLEELYVERTSLESFTGNIYKGRIVNLEPAIQAAFVDFSVGRNGFLHVSDVEPQYYERGFGDEPETPSREGDRDRGRGRGREPRRDRDRAREEPRPARGGEDRGRGYIDAGEDRTRDREEPRPARDWGVDWDFDRDRPDRSEKGRKDRSRRFGEGLTDEPEEEMEAPAPSEPSREEPVTDLPDFGWAEPPASLLRAAEEGEPKPLGQVSQAPSPNVEADLPPSRTRNRRSAASAASEPAATREPAKKPRRGRGRAKAAVEPTPEPEPETPAIETRPEEPFAASAGPIGGFETSSALEPESPSTEDEPIGWSEPRRRGGGRDAIRARGGDRTPGRPREPERAEPAEPFEPLRPELPERPARPERPAARGRDRDRDRDQPRRERTSAHDRAGEPGYVPRRERGRGAEPAAFEPEHASSIGWSEPEIDESEPIENLLDVEAETELLDHEPASRDEGRPRRRRRRRRRGERDRDRETEGPSGDLGEADVEERGPASHRRPSRFDRHEDEDEDDNLDDLDHEDEDDLVSDTLHEAHAVEEEIDPELEQEIRKEIEEIDELEREMGLRGPIEARPRRGEDRDGPAGQAGRGRGPVQAAAPGDLPPRRRGPRPGHQGERSAPRGRRFPPTSASPAATWS